MDLEKIFDRGPRQVSLWGLRCLGIEEWAVRVVQSMYCNAQIRVREKCQYRVKFKVVVGVHQGSVLSPLLFIRVLEAVSQRFNQRKGVPWQLLHAYDLIIMADTLDECIARLRIWKTDMESKGLRVKMKKTKFLLSSRSLISTLVLSVAKVLEAIPLLALSASCVFTRNAANIRPAGSQNRICLPQLHWTVTAYQRSPFEHD